MSMEASVHPGFLSIQTPVGWAEFAMVTVFPATHSVSLPSAAIAMPVTIREGAEGSGWPVPVPKAGIWGPMVLGRPVTVPSVRRVLVRVYLSVTIGTGISVILAAMAGIGMITAPAAGMAVAVVAAAVVMGAGRQPQGQREEGCNAGEETIHEARPTGLKVRVRNRPVWAELPDQVR
jgi:hypothetical protein